MIYTRRIASPRGAAKVTGTFAGMSLAALVASDARSVSRTGEDRPLYTWLRLQKSLGSGSRVGIVYTGRDDGPFRNDVAGADGRMVFGKIYSLQGLVAVSRTDEPTGNRSGPMIQLAAARDGHRFSARYSFSSIADDFFTASGFISRDSIAHLNIDHGVRFFGREGALVHCFDDEVDVIAQDRVVHDAAAQVISGLAQRLARAVV